MAIETIRVYLPCQTLDGFPSTLEEAEAEDVLAAWTAAWHPRLIAAAGSMPAWASVDLAAPSAPATLEIVPAALDGRFGAQADATVAAGPRVRGVRGRTAIAAAAVAAAGLPAAAPGDEFDAEFVALGLAVLLTEILSRRMRSAADLGASDFAAALVAAARAAAAGRADDAEAGIRDCYAHLETVRARYYPVDFWVLDLVLLADSTLGGPLRAELQSPAPLGIVAAGETIRTLATRHPESQAALRAALAAGRVGACGGRDADTPALDALGAEGVLESLQRGQAAWREHLDAVPLVYAARAGCASPILPQLLADLGYRGAIWSSFDGSRLLETHAGLVRWEGAGGATIGAVSRRPIDVRTAAAILNLPERISDALDHDHTAVLAFAHHPGTASSWLEPLRRVAARSTVLGTFVTPADFFERAADAGTTTSFTADDFPPTPPGPPAAAGRPDHDPISAAVEAAAREAAAVVAAAAPLARLLTAAAAPAAMQDSAAGAGGRGLWFRLTGGRRTGREDLLLDNGIVQLRGHRGTGGMLSLRRPGDRGNRISQQLAVRSTVPDPNPARPWARPEDIAEYTQMRADAVARMKTAAGEDCIESRGRFVTAAGAEAGTFVERMTLVAGLPVAILDVEIRLPEPLTGPTLDHHVACRFAWNENDDVRISRSLHTQGVETARSWFTAPHFVTIHRDAVRGPDDAVTILTGGLPWHLFTEGHVLDTILLGPGGTLARRRIAVALDLPRPWDAALDFLAGSAWRSGPGLPATLRLTGAAVESAADGPTRVRVGLLESAGRAGEVRVEWAAEPLRAAACRPDVAVRIEGRTTVVRLAAYEWLHLDLEFRR